MKSSLVFLSLPCLQEKSNPISAKELVKKWFKGSKTRITNEGVLQDFIRLNSSLFNFLGVTPIVSGSYNDLEISFRTENYIGAIPLKSPITGKPFADLIVYPRYLNESKDNVNDYVEIIYLLKNEIKPEFFESSDLLTRKHVRPPLYYECVKFIDLFFLAIKNHWVKFDSKEEKFRFPKGMIDWNIYIKTEWDPFQKLDFPCRINWLNEFHDGIKELLYVLNLSEEIIYAHGTPIRIRSQVRKKLVLINKVLSGYQPKEIKKIIIRNSDPEIIRQTKLQANKILQSETDTNKAWRVDFSNIFEKYIQYLFSQLAKKIGWTTRSNSRFENISRNTPAWGLRYLEPDLIIFRKEKSIAVDAKYKSHFLNLESNSEYLKEEHRSDLHQITAYCAFQSSEHKLGFLCYPATSINYKRLTYQNNFLTSDVAIYLLGIPITSSGIQDVQREIEKLFTGIVRNEKILS